MCLDFLAESLVIRKLYRDQHLTFRRFQPGKTLPKILGDLLRLKIRLKWAIIPFLDVRKS